MQQEKPQTKHLRKIKKETSPTEKINNPEIK